MLDDLVVQLVECWTEVSKVMGWMVLRSSYGRVWTEVARVLFMGEVVMCYSKLGCLMSFLVTYFTFRSQGW